VGGTPEVAAPRQIGPLTGVRGLAALWVAGCHLVAEPGLVSGLAARILARGYLAVDLFFILSGFVMALNYGHLFKRRIRVAVFSRFLLLRLARLYPLYGSILLVRFGYTALRYGSFDLPRPWIAAPLPYPAIDLPANLLLVQSWGIAKSSIGPAWSVSTEWGAYMVFPVLAMLGLWRGHGTATGAAAG
jgi:peptidoglycan/LPS O-acetylase OafA/YrhL